MGNNRKLSKYKNMPRFNFATVGIAIGIGLIVLLLVFFFKITFEEPGAGVPTNIEQNKVEKHKSPEIPAQTITKPEKQKPTVVIIPPKEEKVVEETKPKQQPEIKKEKKERVQVKPKQQPAKKPEERRATAVKVTSRKLVYVIQIGSFKDKKRAILLKNEITKRGYKVKIVKAIVKGSTWYRVRVGSNPDSNSIKSLIEKLKRERVVGGKLKPVVMK